MARTIANLYNVLTETQTNADVQSFNEATTKSILVQQLCLWARILARVKQTVRGGHRAEIEASISFEFLQGPVLNSREMPAVFLAPFKQLSLD